MEKVTKEKFESKQIEVLSTALEEFADRNGKGTVTLAILRELEEKVESAHSNGFITDQNYHALLESMASANCSKLTDPAKIELVKERSRKIGEKYKKIQSSMEDNNYDEMDQRYASLLANLGSPEVIAEELVYVAATEGAKHVMVGEKPVALPENISDGLAKLKLLSDIGVSAAAAARVQVAEEVISSIKQANAKANASKGSKTRSLTDVDDETADCVQLYLEAKAEFEQVPEGKMTATCIRKLFNASRDVWLKEVIDAEQFENDMIEILGDSRVVRGSPEVICEAGVIEKEWLENNVNEMAAQDSEFRKFVAEDFKLTPAA